MPKIAWNAYPLQIPPAMERLPLIVSAAGQPRAPWDEAKALPDADNGLDMLAAPITVARKHHSFK